MIWRSALDLGVTPEVLKRSVVVPIHKGGSKGDPANYRPVSLTSHLVKIFEKIIRKKIVAYMDEYKLFSSSQHGFTAGRSCVSQLLAHFDKILCLLELGRNVDTIYLDFSKAFDKVDHKILMKKLKSIGVGGKIAKWIHSFLHGRIQEVIVNGVKSKPAPVLSGVPQGSVLGPLLFIIMMIDIDTDLLHSFLSSFADDTRVSKDINGLVDTFKLQRDLNAIYAWASINNMKFNADKFELIRYGKDEDLKEISKYLSSDGKLIKGKSDVKDLGVIMSDDCTFKQHIEKVVNKSCDTSSWILRTFTLRSRELMLTLWKSLVIPHLDYCSQLWSPHLRSEIQKLEMTQRSFIRKIEGMYGLSYWNQLKQLKLFSVERRRERYMIMYIWYIIEGLVPNIDSKRKVRSKTHVRHGRSCIVPLVKESRYKEIVNGSFLVHGVKLFNAMPKSVRNATNCSKEKFKALLDEELAKIPDEPQIPGYTAQRRADSNSIIDMRYHRDSAGLNELDV